ncbi:substrate-binding domain-containing protein [Erwinia sp. MYb375]|uniref:Sugar ABC transporter n=1 Tax=Erwinia rhapontici TaxID=55212 RepID=A0ABN6DKU4_ERWRD|nr:substrate-binding domain-containing protein [Erwinia rhapontici]TDS99870.1 monosaccharide ABC transporter substrate-binding protein (CUT2 family) [Erwinia rhapontici]BCQ34428.1 sugar ABC transporter [Erwinia rhapontici]BCQ39264.1 sugar ABC transporter [Erwinia rhapontici]BCQ44427.1 sugar ABC transporter [Erwinia rhapontici]
MKITCAFALAVMVSSAAYASNDSITIGLITKTDTNPFFLKMKEGAMLGATVHGVKLLTAAGKEDGDYPAQIQAIQEMVAAGATTLLITPSDAKAIVPALDEVRAKGVQVIALDSPTDPMTAVDALFGTDNYKAGQLIGEYAKAAMPLKFAGQPLKIAMLDLSPGHLVGARRHNGFMSGLGLAAAGADSSELSVTAETVCAGFSQGAEKEGYEVMASCLKSHPDINLVYTINEPAAAGAYKALQEAGKQAMIVSVDGGCAGVNNVRSGKIAATAQQYPLTMAAMGVDAAVAYARHGKKVSGYVDTGVTLIADKPMPGLASKDTQAGLNACFGAK